MILLNILIIAVILIFLMYVAKWFFARLILSYRIKRFCRKNCVSLVCSKRLWMFSSNRCKKCDFHIEIENKILSVKILSPPVFRLTKIIFNEKGEYFFEYSIPIISFFTSTVHNPIRTKSKKYIDYIFDIDRKGDNFKQEKILLTSSAFSDAIKLHSNGKKDFLYGGEFLTNNLIYQTASSFLII